MPSPTVSLATLRPDLAGSFEEFDLLSNQLGFVGLSAFPVFETAQATGTFGRITDAELLKTQNTLRAPGSPYSRSKTRFQTDTFVTRDHGHEEPVDDNEAKMYAEYFDAEMVAARRARHAVLLNHERRVIDLITDTGVWTGAALTTAVSNPWTSIGSGTPVANVSAANAAVYAGIGQPANAVIMSWNRFNACRNTEEFLERVKYSGTDARNRNITRDVMAQVFGVDFVFVAGGVRNTADEGQNAVKASMWPDARVMVCRVATTEDIRETCIGRTFHWGEDGSQIGGVLESYRDETVRGDVIRCRMQTDEKRLYVAAGHLLTSV